MLERDRISLQEWRREEAQREARERIEREKPLRDAEAALQKSATELGAFTRNLIATGKDPDAFVDPSTVGRSMTVADASRFNGEQAKIFRNENSWFYRSEENMQALLDYFVRNGLQIITSDMLTRAAVRLRDYGLLLDAPTPVEPEQVPDQPEVASQSPGEPELFEGQDPATGRPQLYTKREVEKMDSLTYRKVFGLYGDNSPRFVYPNI